MATREDEFVTAGFIVTKSDIEDLKRLAQAEGTNVNDILRRAIATYKFFREKEKEGKTILLSEKDRKFERVRLP
ncbi:MAG: ribbon-helix-helix protein, CopG family [Geminicoccaceae bacterium]|nr:ribbon-helix-helix protein, CopG family [Geminicoccaceae bacterium]MCS7269077.1 ribbon-helix-helix protein, CopG family [Geminicoccaceae bacterium]MCX7630750.1 ribbon-helix-helix protein, CopG family [Geminicoccaceae bacterium]MDW8125814.1 ribbon-helix-helix protein, CopG family [Geminicoccaceae bacterium]MDW8342702.1 ribbon-helix-helix protein, CopG family [Geminicoccaceae bacterium]